MPKTNINYENTIMYKISCKDEECKDIYVGQTCDFTRRKYAHKNASQKKNVFLYKVICDNGGWENWEMKEIEKYAGKSKQDVLNREQYWINTLQANLNMHVRYDPSEYKRDWYFKNRERIAQYAKDKKANKIHPGIRLQGYNGIDMENPPDWVLENMKNQKIDLEN
jgi:hypothetical protein